MGLYKRINTVGAELGQRVEVRHTGINHDEDCAIVGWSGARPVGPDDGYPDDVLMVLEHRGGVEVPVKTGEHVVKDDHGFYPVSDGVLDLFFTEADDA